MSKLLIALTIPLSYLLVTSTVHAAPEPGCVSKVSQFKAIARCESSTGSTFSKYTYACQNGQRKEIDNSECYEYSQAYQDATAYCQNACPSPTPNSSSTPTPTATTYPTTPFPSPSFPSRISTPYPTPKPTATTYPTKSPLPSPSYSTYPSSISSPIPIIKTKNTTPLYCRFTCGWKLSSTKRNTCLTNCRLRYN